MYSSGFTTTNRKNVSPFSWLAQTHIELCVYILWFVRLLWWLFLTCDTLDLRDMPRDCRSRYFNLWSKFQLQDWSLSLMSYLLINWDNGSFTEYRNEQTVGLKQDSIVTNLRFWRARYLRLSIERMRVLDTTLYLLSRKHRTSRGTGDPLAGGSMTSIAVDPARS